jgi:SecD/SecF fusion protein
MQNKGAIQLIAVLFTLVSIYQLSFTWVSSSVKSDAVEYAAGDRMKEVQYLDSISGQTVYNFLWLQKFNFKEVQEKELNLGLDLRGGMNVMLEVSIADLIRALSDYNDDPAFLQAINLAKERKKDSQEDFLTLFGEAFEETTPDGKLASFFQTLDLKDRINYNSTNDDVLKVLKEESESAIANSFNVIRNRIDRFGVTQPNIQRLENSGRILVELPGIKDPERVRKLLQGTANLQFWETYDNQEVISYLQQANDGLKNILDFKTEAQDSTLVLDSASQTQSLLENIDEAKDSLNQVKPETRDEFNQQNPLFAILYPNVTQQGQAIEGAAVGTSHWKDTAIVMEYLNKSQIRQLFPRNLRFMWEYKAVDAEGAGIYHRLVAIKASGREGKPALDGDVVTNARADFGNNQAFAEVSMTMNSLGAKTWARITKDNIGKQVAIVLDGFVYSYPVVQNEIKGGSSSITGNFTIAEANDLANVLKSGKLPAPAHIIEEEIVGPSLGQEAIDKGLSSFAFAFIIVLIYMLFYYNKSGIAANLALLVNLLFIIGILASLGAVLTLPGIAGIVLTIGMSVDANVLIFERIREELYVGKGLKLAVKDGYSNAYSAIIDANVTTLMTGIILYVFGTGPIKGFATTLVIGILSSLFTAIFITRIIFEAWLAKKQEISFSTKFTEGAFKNLNIDFLSKRKLFYIISSTIILLGVVSLIFKGLNLGVDFKGGRTYVVRFENEVVVNDVAKALAVTLDGAPEVKVYGENNQVKITTDYLIDEDGEDVDQRVESALFLGLKPILGENVTEDVFLSDYRMSSQKVGPTIADDIKVQAIEAIIIALIFMFFYILIRFKNWQYGLGAVAALAHDVLIVMGLFSILYGFMPFSLEIDQAFIAAILTVVGYSVNDTVIVFDRIREYITLHPKRERYGLYNEALNSTLSRTFNTSITTLVVLLVIFIFGGEVIRGFVFAMLVGITVGTYSSLFIATPLVFDTVKDPKVEDKTKGTKTQTPVKA